MAFHYVKEHVLGPFLMLMGASKHPLVGRLRIPAGNAFGMDSRLGAACAPLTVLCRPGFQAPIRGSAPLAVCAFLRRLLGARFHPMGTLQQSCPARSRPCPPAPMVLPAEGGRLSFESTLAWLRLPPETHGSRPEGSFSVGWASCQEVTVRLFWKTE